MANEIQTAPNTTPTTDADWAAELNLRELSMKGYDGISLTEWAAGDTDRPQIAAGSVIEIDGAIAKFASQTAITDEGGIADGWCYVKFVVSGSDVVPTLTNTFGTWDTAKQGFYATNDRYSLHVMYRSGAVTKIYTQKGFVFNNGTFIQTPLQTDVNAQGHVEYSSDYFAGQKIKYKVFRITIPSPDTSYDLTHGISNAFTDQRVIDIRTSCYRAGSLSAFAEGYDTGIPVDYSISYYRVDNTKVRIIRAETSSQVYQVLIMYV